MSKYDRATAALGPRPTTGKPRPKAAPASTPGGREKKGKREHPDYRQVAIRIRKATHDAAWDVIGRRGDFSDLIERILSDWLRQQNRSRVSG